MTSHNVPLEIGTLLKNEDNNDIGVIIDAYYFDDTESKKYNEYWLLQVLIKGKILEGWLQDWDEWKVIN